MSPDAPAGSAPDSATAPNTTGTSAVPDELRSKLALALDLDDLVEALRLARMLRPWFGVAKVGLELYCAAGPDAVSSLTDAGFEVFVDLKLLDIPTTVQHASKVLGSLGARYLTLHARGDSPMLRAGVEGLHEGAAAAGLPDPVALAVTVLTSDDTAPPHVVPHRIALAVESGCGGIVCAAADVHDAKELAPRLVTVVPGIRPKGSEAHDQTRAATPRQAIDAGADLLVIGRAVTQADDPAAAAAAVVGELV
jgi:orotidine-5'-phosphate decarboxylase